MKLHEFMSQLRKDIASFEEHYRAGIDGPDLYDDEMNEADWYEQYECWLSMQQGND